MTASTASGDHGRPDSVSSLSPTEATLTGIWSELLDQRDIGPDDDFFERGGDSLLAVWLIEEIAERTGRELPLSVLLDGATIRQLASAIDAQPAEPDIWRGVNLDGTQPPLFWIHGWAELLSMRAHFDSDQPIFQIEDPLSRRWQVKPPLERTAARYVQELRRIQRTGPYRLIGYSFAGVIAYEMARQLLAAGERVEFLGMLDSPAPGYAFPLPVRLRMQSANLAQFRRVLDESRTRSWLGRGAYLRHAIPAITRHRSFRWLLARLPRDWQVPTPPGSIVRVRYEPKRYAGQITLFWASEGWGRPDRTPDLGWSPLAGGGLSVRAVPGNHRTMAYGANARVLADDVTECLSRSAAAQPLDRVAGPGRRRGIT